MSQNFLSTPAAAPAAPSGPTAERGPKQADGTVSPMGTPPTKTLSPSRTPASPGTSGMERGMAELADKLHPPRRR